MILVIGIVVFVAGLTATAAVIATNGLGQSRKRIHFEQSLAAAEAGIDYALSHLQYAFDESHADYPIPDTGVPVAACTASTVTLPDLEGDEEQAWAEAELDTLAAEHPECIMSTPSGEVLILKPANPVGGAGIQYGRVFARGWSPERGVPGATARTIKVEYVFMPYKPQHAILTGTNLLLQSTSTDVTGAYGVDPTLAAVHTNGSLSTTGNPTVTGQVSVSLASGSGNSSNFTANPGGVPITTAPVRIPRVSARAFYRQAPSQDGAAMARWTDLCPDGSAHAYPVDDPDDEISPTPCSGVTVGGSPYNGWQYNPGLHKWTATRDTVSGTYFVFEADVDNGSGNGAIPNITVVAAAANPDDCATKRYGNIRWDHYDTPAPAFKNLFFLADGDLSATSNFYSGSSTASGVISGMYVAGEEVQVWTSSSGLVGSVLAENRCPSVGTTSPDDSGPVLANEVQGQIVKFDPNGDSPFSSLISTILWLEY